VPGRFQALLDDPEIEMLVAEEEVLCGFITFGSSRDAGARAETGEIRSLFVAPAFWRSGVGSALLGRALEELPSMGHREATVWSFAANERANAFYESHRFARDGAERREEVWADLLEVRYRR
jgi:GNAT superfamily N-acetyltransferase